MKSSITRLPVLIAKAFYMFLLLFSLTVVHSLGSEVDKPNKVGMAKDAKIKIDAAVKTAKQKVPGTVTKAELETEHGYLMWEIEIVTQEGSIFEVHLSADTGKVIDH